MRRTETEAAAKWGVAALLLLALLMSVSLASAQEEDGITVGPQTEFFLPFGLTTGASFGSKGTGGFLGGELSAVWLNEGLWGGLYADAFFDFGESATSVTAGPELGLGVLGVDGGVGVRFGREDDPEIGAQGRVMLSLAGAFTLFGRYGFWPDSKGAEHVFQVGVLIKMPLATTGQLRPIAF